MKIKTLLYKLSMTSLATVLFAIAASTGIFADECLVYPSRAYQDGYIDEPYEISIASQSELDEATIASLKTDIKAAWDEMSETLDLNDYSFSQEVFINEVLPLYSTVLNENPNYFYVTGSFSYYTTTKIIKPRYNFKKDELAAANKRFDAAVADALEHVRLDSMSDMDIALALHDYLVLTAEYDVAAYEAETVTDRNTFSAYGVLVNKLGVCQSYTLAYNYLLGLCGIDSSFITTKLPDGVGHIWSLVKIGDEYYQTDVTWDDPIIDKKGVVTYDYFLLNDDEFAADEKHGTSYSNPYPTASTAFSNAFWRLTNTGVAYLDGNYYFTIKNEASYTLNSSSSERPSEYEKLRDISGTGFRIEGVDGMLSGARFRATPFVANGKLYYNNAHSIFEYNADAETDTAVYTSDITYGFISPQPQLTRTSAVLMTLTYASTDANSFTYSPAYAAPLTLVGDISGDKSIDAADTALLTRYIAAWSGYDMLPCPQNGDLNNDGKIDSSDITILSRYIAMWSGYAALPLI